MIGHKSSIILNLENYTDRQKRVVMRFLMNLTLLVIFWFLKQILQKYILSDKLHFGPNIKIKSKTDKDLLKYSPNSTTCFNEKKKLFLSLRFPIQSKIIRKLCCDNDDFIFNYF